MCSCDFFFPDEGKRGGRAVRLKKLADDALDHRSNPVLHVLVVQHTGGEVSYIVAEIL